MATRAVDAVFIDTNVLVYATMVPAPQHVGALAALRQYSSGTSLWISRQVLREYLATLSRPQSFGGPRLVPLLIGDLQYFEQRFEVADETATVTSHLMTLLQQIPIGGKQVHDANLVATMQVYGIQRLLTYNGADFVRFSSQITVIPLL